MNMIRICLSAAALVALSTGAMAYENYIPLGTGYSTTVDSLPSFDSDQGQIIERTDVYETEQYLLNRKRAEQDSRLQNFFSRSESSGVDNSIDY
jgi:hypothetical protein